MKRIITITFMLFMVFALLGCKSKGNMSLDEGGGLAAATDTSEQKDTDSIAEDINQLELDIKNNPYGGDSTSRLKFKSVSEMVMCIKNPEKFTGNVLAEATDDIEYENYKNRQEEFEKKGGKGDYRFEYFNTSDLNYFYTIKDIPEYTLTDVELSGDIVRFYYLPDGEEKVTENDKIMVTYYRPDNFVTDNYFEDYAEYYQKTILEEKYIYQDNWSSDNEEWNFSTIAFPVENTMIDIYAKSEDLKSFEALKKLCVAQKVIVN